MSLSKTKLPETVRAGDEIEIQLAPFGTYRCHDGDHDGQPQKLTRAAFGAIVANAGGKEILVDVDHQSLKGDGSTEAAAWLHGLRVDDSRGLLCTIKLTDLGADLVTNRRYRFVSVAWRLNARNEPYDLDSVALTNRPNLPVDPVLNSKAGGPQKNNNQKEKTMEKIIAALGLPADAGEDAVLAAIADLQKRVAEQEEAARNAEAEAFAKEHDHKCDRVGNEQFTQLAIIAKAYAGITMG